MRRVSVWSRGIAVGLEVVIADRGYESTISAVCNRDRLKEVADKLVSDGKPSYPGSA